MRITADIIDEEPSDPLDLVSRNLATGTLVDNNAKESDLNWFFKNFAVQHESQNEASSHQFTTKTQMKQHFQKMHEEVTQKFKNLHLSDAASSSRRNSHQHTASSSNQMEEPADFPKDLEAAPAWLQQYLLKMKDEIKKEVLEELLQSGPSGEAHSSKIPTGTTKLHDLQDEIVHMGIYCDNCDQIIQGIRYKCVNCSDFDLCQECESLPYIHNAYHMFLKVRHPLPLRLKPLMDEPPSASRPNANWKNRKQQTKKLYEARFIRDDTVPDSTVLAPSTQFVKTWRIMNSGTRVWNHSTKLQLIQGSAELTPTSDQVDVPHLRPGEVGVVSVVFQTPPLPGLYRSHWNFCHKSRPFGDIVWCHIIVHADGTRTDKAVGAPKIVLPPKRKTEGSPGEATCIEQVLSAVQKEHERGNMVPRKLVATSHTATPNNTPFDLTPPKSPDHHETSVKELQNLSLSPASHQNSASSAKVSDNEDDKCSVVSLGSSESDTEFVVIPMPKCFNMSESFLSQNIPQQCNQDDGPQETCSITDDQILKSYESLKLKCPTPLSIQSMNAMRRSRTVSQETGVPEHNFPENNNNNFEQQQTVLRFVEQQQNAMTLNYVTVTTDGSSSEISIIESAEESSPVAGGSSTINISVNSDDGTLRDGSAEDSGVGRAVDEEVERAVEEGVVQCEEAVDIPSNATFPKFPIEGITSTFDPSPASNEERTIQVLPEGLVTGALSAAASVYNTARAAINAMHQTRVEQGVVLDAPILEPQPTPLNPMDQLVDMGFCNRAQNDELLRKHKGDVALVVAELVSQNDNDWYNSRHIPSSRPPAFD